MGLRPAQRSTEITAEFRNEVDRDAGVHPSLAIEKLRLVIERHHRAVPHIRVQVERAAAIAPEADELLRRDVVSRQREGTTKLCARSGWKSCPPSG